MHEPDRATVHEEENDEPLDPRIQQELDTLNKASSDVNNLKNSLEEERQNYEKIFLEATQKLNSLQSKLKSAAINKARPYHEAKQQLNDAQVAAQAAAKRYDRAISEHEASQQMVSIAEAVGFNNEDSLAWQEMLNAANSKVTQAELELVNSEKEHEVRMTAVTTLTSKVNELQKEFRFSIRRSMPYYEAKSITQAQMEEQLRRIRHIESRLQESKQKYATALNNLEIISEEIHYQRQSKIGRGRGVGAESDEIEELDSRSSVEANNNVADIPYVDTSMPAPPLESSGTPEFSRRKLGRKDSRRSVSGRSPGRKLAPFSPITPEQAKEMSRGELQGSTESLEESHNSPPFSNSLNETIINNLPDDLRALASREFTGSNRCPDQANDRLSEMSTETERLHNSLPDLTSLGVEENMARSEGQPGETRKRLRSLSLMGRIN